MMRMHSTIHRCSECVVHLSRVSISLSHHPHPYIIIIILLNKTNYNIRFALRNRRLLNQWQAALECVRAMRFAECLRHSIVATFLRFLFKVARHLWNQYPPDAVWLPSFMNTPEVNLHHLLNLSAFAQLAHVFLSIAFSAPTMSMTARFLVVEVSDNKAAVELVQVMVRK